MAKNLLIIGNGFDLDLGLKTKYSEYIESAKQRHAMQGNVLFNSICEKHDNCNWIDIEMFIKEYAISLSNGRIKNDNIAEEFETLRKDLCTYMDSEIWKYGDIVKRHNPYRIYSSAGNVFKAVSKNGKFEVLSFNYTNMDNLAEKIRLDNKPICNYVHGEAGRYNIVLGADDSREIKPAYCFVLKSVQKSKSHFVEEKLNNADNVIIFGHSLGETDYHYFSTFFKKQSNIDTGNFHKKTICIFTKDKQDIYNQLNQMSKDVDYQRMSDINDFYLFTVNDTWEVEDMCKEIENW